MPILGMQNLHAGAVEYIQKNYKRIAVEKIEPSFAKDLQLKNIQMMQERLLTIKRLTTY
ncbi:hypothetical protein HpCHN51_15020 [Helicobacter pylori]